MNSHKPYAGVVLALMLAVAGGARSARADEPAAAPVDSSERVFQYDLSGPRLGGTLLPNGDMTTQFGWHAENQASPGHRGPWFIIERVFLVAGTERSQFIPSGTLVFGMRMPDSFEFGLGPSVTIGGGRGINTGVVLAAGRSFRTGGIRIPVDLAMASERGGTVRWTLVTGWAIRDRAN
jgi:hypothetical protein